MCFVVVHHLLLLFALYILTGLHGLSYDISRITFLYGIFLGVVGMYKRSLSMTLNQKYIQFPFHAFP